jgi:anti-anti-sigma regulatory factor
MTSKSNRVINSRKIKKFESQIYGDIIICSVFLEKFSLKCMDEFKSELNSIADAEIQNIIIDISFCSFVSFSVWCALIIFFKNLTKTGGRLIVVCNYQLLRPIISHTGVDKIFVFRSEVNEAINYFLETD